MHVAPFQPEKHLFVCTNERAAGSPLGPGCGARGRALFEALKARTLDTGCAARIWITETKCQGICPKVGATVSRYVHGGHGDSRADSGRVIFTEVELGDLGQLLGQGAT